MHQWGIQHECSSGLNWGWSPVKRPSHLMVYSRVPSSFSRRSLFGVVMLCAMDFLPLRKKVSGVQMLLASRLFKGSISIGPLKHRRSSFQLWRKNTSIVYSCEISRQINTGCPAHPQLYKTGNNKRAFHHFSVRDWAEARDKDVGFDLCHLFWECRFHTNKKTVDLLVNSSSSFKKKFRIYTSLHFSLTYVSICVNSLDFNLNDLNMDNITFLKKNVKKTSWKNLNHPSCLIYF